MPAAVSLTSVAVAQAAVAEVVMCACTCENGVEEAISGCENPDDDDGDAPPAVVIVVECENPANPAGDVMLPVWLSGAILPGTALGCGVPWPCAPATPTAADMPLGEEPLS